MKKLHEGLTGVEKKIAIKLQELRMEALTEKLKKQPTKIEKVWYDFATRNTGYEFLNLETGSVYSKLAFFQLHKYNNRSLNLVSEDALDGWKKRLKSDWTIDKTGTISVPVLREFQPIYKKKEE